MILNLQLTRTHKAAQFGSISTSHLPVDGVEQKLQLPPSGSRSQPPHTHEFLFLTDRPWGLVSADETIVLATVSV